MEDAKAELARHHDRATKAEEDKIMLEWKLRNAAQSAEPTNVHQHLEVARKQTLKLTADLKAHEELTQLHEQNAALESKVFMHKQRLAGKLGGGQEIVHPGQDRGGAPLIHQDTPAPWMQKKMQKDVLAVAGKTVVTQTAVTQTAVTMTSTEQNQSLSGSMVMEERRQVMAAAAEKRQVAPSVTLSATVHESGSSLHRRDSGYDEDEEEEARSKQPISRKRGKSQMGMGVDVSAPKQDASPKQDAYSRRFWQLADGSATPVTNQEAANQEAANQESSPKEVAERRRFWQMRMLSAPQQDAHHRRFWQMGPKAKAAQAATQAATQARCVSPKEVAARRRRCQMEGGVEEDVKVHITKRGRLENWVWHREEQFYSGNIYDLDQLHVQDGDAYETR
jgi:hypothetical protein